MGVSHFAPHGFLAIPGISMLYPPIKNLVHCQNVQNESITVKHRHPKLTTREIDRINDLCKRIEWDVTT